MTYVYFHANFDKAWLSEKRIQVVSDVLLRPWGAELFGLADPTRRATRDGLAKAAAAVGTGSVALGSRDGSAKRVVGDLINGGRVLDEWDDEDVHETGRLALSLSLPSADFVEEIHAFYSWLISLPECVLGSFIMTPDADERSWLAYRKESANARFETVGLPFVSADSFYGERLVSHLPSGALPPACQPFAGGLRIASNPLEIPADVEAARQRVQSMSSTLVDAGVCGIPRRGGMRWRRGPNWTPIAYDPSVDPASATPEIALEGAREPAVRPHDPERAHALTASIRDEWRKALLHDIGDDALEALAFRLVDELDEVRNLDPAFAEAARYQVELLLGPVNDIRRAGLILDELRTQPGQAAFVAQVDAGACPAPFK
jgi:hypothetical protein